MTIKYYCGIWHYYDDNGRLIREGDIATVNGREGIPIKLYDKSDKRHEPLGPCYLRNSYYATKQFTGKESVIVTDSPFTIRYNCGII